MKAQCPGSAEETTPAIVDFPTPPFADETAMTFFTSLILRFSGRPRRRENDGGVPERGSPYGQKDQRPAGR